MTIFPKKKKKEKLVTVFFFGAFDTNNIIFHMVNPYLLFPYIKNTSFVYHWPSQRKHPFTCHDEKEKGNIKKKKKK